MLVANWTLTSANGPPPGTPSPWPHGDYTLFSNGVRGFFYQSQAMSFSAVFDTSGHLAQWESLDQTDAGRCSTILCDQNEKWPGSSDAYVCNMVSDPQPAGTAVFPTTGQTNGPGPNCEVDANGRWSMPGVTSN
jgi:hypothetical protein